MGVCLVVGMVVGVLLVLAVPEEFHPVFLPFRVAVDFCCELLPVVQDRFDPPEGHIQRFAKNRVQAAAASVPEGTLLPSRMNLDALLAAEAAVTIAFLSPLSTLSQDST